MDYRVLLTGSEGLVGRSLRGALTQIGIDVVGMDLLAAPPERGDVRDAGAVQDAVAGCAGVVHLAAVSRVVEAEREPDACWSTNVHGLANVLEAVGAQRRPPWVLFASSREVYGQPEHLPVTEDAPLRPVNVYGRSKAEGERLVLTAAERGLRTAVVRLANVYGATRDHADRVVPAFARAAALGRDLRVDGPAHTFDFTHLDDTVRGLLGLIDLLVSQRPAPPPVHLVTGRPTSLGHLAELAVRLGGSGSRIRAAPSRSYDVSHFHGDPTRASHLLGWATRVPLADGLGRLIQDFKRELGAPCHAEVAP